MLDFYKGMDVSFIPELLEEGMKCYDFDGTTIEPLDLAKKYGVNAIRLRIWHTPSNVEESKGYCSLEHTIKMAKEIYARDLDFMLDFHYSDYWADPGKQRKPKAWEELSFEQLVDAVYEYTKDTLLTLKKEKVLPQIVQIGNEIRSGLLFPDGEAPNYKQMVQLINAGIKGAREVATKEEMQIMIHLDQGGRYVYLKDWFDHTIEEGLEEFDLIGISYYPFWHGTFMDLKYTMEQLIERYKKPIMVVECAHAWRKSIHGFIDEEQEKIAGFPATPQGQRQVIDLVMNIVASLPNNMGLGVYYWEPLCIPKEGEGGWSENMGILDEKGNVLETIHSFEFTRDKLKVGTPAKVYDLKPQTFLVGTEGKLPQVASVLYFDGTVKEHKIVWNEDTTWRTVLGEHTICGKVEEILVPITQKVTIVKEFVQVENLVEDENWDCGFVHWQVEKSSEQVVVSICPEEVDPFPAPPVNYVLVESPSNFTFSLIQKVNVEQKGNYCLSVEYEGTDTTDVNVALVAKQTGANGDGQVWKKVIHPTEHGWSLHQMKDIPCEVGVMEIGIEIQSPPIYGKIRRLQFVLQDKK